tara:strand:+ start:354 stop:1079 length:726 start_codon:yes stop_codon:yes gene_type:complete
MVTKKQKKIIKDIKKTSKELNDKGLSRVEILRITAASIGGLVFLSSLGLGTGEIVSRMKKSEEARLKRQAEEKNTPAVAFSSLGNWNIKRINKQKRKTEEERKDKKAIPLVEEYINKHGLRNRKKIYPSGNVYEGQWKNSKRDGQGIMIYKDDRTKIYKGQWKDGMKHGQGIMVFKNGDEYEGQWKYNLPNGQGTMLFKNGHRYEGQWKDGKLDGKVEYTTGGLNEPVIMEWNNGKTIEMN